MTPIAVYGIGLLEGRAVDLGVAASRTSEHTEHNFETSSMNASKVHAAMYATRIRT